MNELFLKEFQKLKILGDEIFSALKEEFFFTKLKAESSSLADLVREFHKKFGAKTADFSKTENEKIGQKSGEFSENSLSTKREILKIWSESWENLFKNFSEVDLGNSEKLNETAAKKLSISEKKIHQLSECAFLIGKMDALAKILQTEKAEISTTEKPENPAEMPENSSPVCYAKSDEVRDEYKI
jgi:hypothetical protein